MGVTALTRTPGPASQDQYAGILAKLLPRGALWAVTRSPRLAAYLQGLGAELARVHDRILDAITESDPRTATETLADWEALLGITQPATTPEERRRQVTALWIASGGQTPAYFLSLAERIGYAVIIEEPKAARFGKFRCGTDRLYDTDWAYTWIVRVDGGTITAPRFGSWRLPQRLREWSFGELAQLFGKWAPAHTKPLFLVE